MKRETTAYSTLAGPAGERYDCSVRALTLAAGIPYAEAHAAFQGVGRVTGKRTPWPVSTDLYTRRGYTLHTTVTGVCGRVRYMTVAQFVKAHPVGRFILHRRGHAFALIDGVVNDWDVGTGPRSRLCAAWEVPR